MEQDKTDNFKLKKSEEPTADSYIPNSFLEYCRMKGAEQ